MFFGNQLIYICFGENIFGSFEFGVGHLVVPGGGDGGDGGGGGGGAHLVDGVGDVEVAPGGDGHPAVACIAGPRPHRAVVVVRAAAIPDHVHIMLV